MIVGGGVHDLNPERGFYGTGQVFPDEIYLGERHQFGYADDKAGGDDEGFCKVGCDERDDREGRYLGKVGNDQPVDVVFLPECRDKGDDDGNEGDTEADGVFIHHSSSLR